jgi:hypothetical protein
MKLKTKLTIRKMEISQKTKWLLTSLALFVLATVIIVHIYDSSGKSLSGFYCVVEQSKKIPSGDSKTDAGQYCAYVQSIIDNVIKGYGIDGVSAEEAKGSFEAAIAEFIDVQRKVNMHHSIHNSRFNSEIVISYGKVGESPIDTRKLIIGCGH